MMKAYTSTSSQMWFSKEHPSIFTSHSTDIETTLGPREVPSRKSSLLLGVEETSGPARYSTTEVLPITVWRSGGDDDEVAMDLNDIVDLRRGEPLFMLSQTNSSNGRLHWQASAPETCPTSSASTQSTPELHPDYSPLSETSSAPYTPEASPYEGLLTEAREPPVIDPPHICNDDLVASVKKSGVIDPVQLLSPQKPPILEDPSTIDVDESPLLSPEPLLFSPPAVLSLFSVMPSLLRDCSSIEAELYNKALRCGDGSSVMWQDNPADEGSWAELCSSDQFYSYSQSSYLDTPPDEEAPNVADNSAEAPCSSQLPTEPLTETTAQQLRPLSPLTSCDSPLSSPRPLRPLPKRAARKVALGTWLNLESDEVKETEVDDDTDAGSGYSGDESVGSRDDGEYVPVDEVGRKRKTRTGVVITQRKRARREHVTLHAAKLRAATSERNQTSYMAGSSTKPEKSSISDGSMLADRNPSIQSDDNDAERSSKTSCSKASRNPKSRSWRSGGRDQRSGKCVSCRYCNKTFSRGHDAKRHENNTCVYSPTYKQDEVGKCPLCGKADLSRKDSMQRHISKCKRGQ